MDHHHMNNNSSSSSSNNWLSFSLSPYLAMDPDQPQHPMSSHHHHHHQVASSATTTAANSATISPLDHVYNSGSRGSHIQIDHHHHHHHHQPQLLSPAPPHTPRDHTNGYHPPQHVSFTSQMLEIAGLRPSLANNSGGGQDNPVSSNLAMMGATLTNHSNHNAGGWQFKGEMMEASHEYNGMLFSGSGNATDVDNISNTEYERMNTDGDGDNKEQVSVMNPNPNVMMMMSMVSGGGREPNVEEGGPKLEDFLGCGTSFTNYNGHHGGHNAHLNPNPNPNPNLHPHPNHNPHLNPNPNPSPHLNPNTSHAHHLNPSHQHSHHLNPNPNPNHLHLHGHTMQPMFYQGVSHDEHVGAITITNTISSPSQLRPPKTEHRHSQNNQNQSNEHNHNHNNNSINTFIDEDHYHHHHHHHTQQHNDHGNYHDPSLKDHSSQHYNKFYQFDPSTQHESSTLVQMQEEGLHQHQHQDHHHNHHGLAGIRDNHAAEDSMVGFKSALKTWLGHHNGAADEKLDGFMKESNGVSLQQSLSLSMNPCLLPHTQGLNIDRSGHITTNPSRTNATNSSGIITHPSEAITANPSGFHTDLNPSQGTMVISTTMARQESRKRGSNKAVLNKGHAPRKSLDTFGQRTSQYRGVTRHRWTGRYEAHLWDNSCRKEGQTRKGRQVYLGGYDKEDKAARAYDLAALKYWGPTTHTNFPTSTYKDELEEMKNMSRQEYVASLRRKSSGFSRGASVYRGVTRHHQQGRWQARIGRVAGNKDLYLGTFSTQEEAAEAYDIAAIKFRGVHAVTNFETTRYDVQKICSSNTLLAGQEARRKIETNTNDALEEARQEEEEENEREDGDGDGAEDEDEDGDKELSKEEESIKKTKGKKELQFIKQDDDECEGSQTKLVCLEVNDEDEDEDEDEDDMGNYGSNHSPLMEDHAIEGSTNHPGEILPSVLPSLSNGSSSSSIICPAAEICPNVNALLLAREDAENDNHAMMMMMGSPENSMSEVDDGSPKQILTIPGEYTKALSSSHSEHDDYHRVPMPWMLNDSNLQQQQQQQQHHHHHHHHQQPPQSVVGIRGSGGHLQPMFAAWNET